MPTLLLTAVVGSRVEPGVAPGGEVGGGASVIHKSSVRRSYNLQTTIPQMHTHTDTHMHAYTYMQRVHTLRHKMVVYNLMLQSKKICPQSLQKLISRHTRSCHTYKHFL